jgi:hypothetical protein
MDDIIKGIGVVIFFLLWGLGPILKGIAERNAKRARDVQRPQQAPRQRAVAMRGVPNPEAEVERFLREVARERGGERASVTAEIVLGEDEMLKPRPQRTPASKKKPPRRASASPASIESRHMTGTLLDRPDRHSELEYADEKMADHVHDVFDHKLGQLGATTGSPAAADAPVVAPTAAPIISGTAIATSAARMADLLRDPARVRQAILIHEILGPPRCESADMARSG